jgi:hypothetical protein
MDRPRLGEIHNPATVVVVDVAVVVGRSDHTKRCAVGTCAFPTPGPGSGPGSRPPAPVYLGIAQLFTPADGR